VVIMGSISLRVVIMRSMLPSLASAAIDHVSLASHCVRASCT
jgi:hypothetical protein